MPSNYLESVKKQFNTYRSLGERAINQVKEEKMLWQYELRKQ